MSGEGRFFEADIQAREPLEGFCFVIEDADDSFMCLIQILDPGIPCNQTFRPLVIWQRQRPENPNESWIGETANRLAKAGLIDEVCQINPHTRIEAALAWQLGSRAGSSAVEISGAGRVAPKPVELAPVGLDHD